MDLSLKIFLAVLCLACIIITIRAMFGKMPYESNPEPSETPLPPVERRVTPVVVDTVVVPLEVKEVLAQPKKLPPGTASKAEVTAPVKKPRRPRKPKAATTTQTTPAKTRAPK